MRIAHVVTLVSEQGAFGGPISVARGQTQELARRGHSVHLLAGWDGKDGVNAEGVDVQLFPVRRVLPAPGFSGLVAPGLLRSLRSLAAGLDVVHIHLARDLITLGAARLIAGKAVRLVTQTHGMVMPDSRLIAQVADVALTRRILRATSTAAVLTEIEREGLRRVGRTRIKTELVPNGIDVSGEEVKRDPLGVSKVLFCARLHPRKRVMAFAEMARVLILQGVTASFVVAGPDEGDLARLRTFVSVNGLDERFTYIGAVAPDKVREVLAGAAVFVLPSEREPFPMTVLEAMAEGTPTVITNGCMISADLELAGAVIATDGSTDQLAHAVKHLLEDRQAADRLGRRGRDVVREQYSISTVVDLLEAIYAR